MMIEIAETTDEDLFREFVGMMHQEYEKEPKMTDWFLYEHLKGCIKDYEIDYETGIKIITEKIDI